MVAIRTKIRLFIIRAFLSLLAVATLIAVNQPARNTLAQTAHAAEILISPASASVYAGGIGTTSVHLETEVQASSLVFQLKFDPTIISVLDTDLEKDGVQVGINLQLLEAGAVVLRNQADNNAGTIDVEIAGLDSADIVTHLITITWWGRQEGIATISLTSATLTSLDQTPIIPDGQDSTIEVTAAPGDPVFGRVLLEGRSNYGDTTIYVSRDECPDPDEIGQMIVWGDPVATTDRRGYFEVIPVNGEFYLCLQAVQRGYLMAQQSNPRANLGTITLPGGDVNGDDEINIFDLAIIGSRYGDADRDADINADGSVNIFDLVLAANNYGEIGPVEIWR